MSEKGHEQTSVGNHGAGEGPANSMQAGFAKPKKQKGAPEQETGALPQQRR